MNVDIKLELGTLTVASNVPTNNACNIGGYSWISFFNSQNGDVVPGAANLGTKLSDSLAVGLNIVRLPDGRVVVIATTSDSAQVTREAPIAAGAPTGKRISWRELTRNEGLTLVGPRWLVDLEIDLESGIRHAEVDLLSVDEKYKY